MRGCWLLPPGSYIDPTRNFPEYASTISRRAARVHRLVRRRVTILRLRRRRASHRGRPSEVAAGSAVDLLRRSSTPPVKESPPGVYIIQRLG
ncbi:hypothetical protein U9M48_007836 [Paspalum notatum var. saurae]|uniref:Uncharacterized protein n=1 Tax=Paspalum notatum var. saurae TaxID=547442 RepID=A0AAQ3SMX8_PASNO